MLLLGLDLETTGLDFEHSRITEIGAVLWDTDLRLPVQIQNSLVWEEGSPPLSAEVEQLTGLTTSLLRQHGESPYAAVAKLIKMAQMAEALVAHNAGRFDRPMLEAQFRRLGFPFLSHLWIDTWVDVPFPPRTTSRKLVHLAADHGFVNPFSHRAVFDVLTMMRILDPYIATPEGLNAILDSARQPTIVLQAHLASGEEAKASARGYRWRSDRSAWLLNLKANRVEQERAECGFLTTIFAPPA